MKKRKEKSIMFFLGAGASAPMNIPTMRQFTKDFVKFGEDTENRADVGYWLRDLKRVTRTGAWDLERLLILIRQARNINNDVNVGLLSKYLFREGSKSKRRFNDRENSIGIHFERIEIRLLDYIRSRCLNPQMEEAKKIYSKILPFSKEGVLEIFTTNYDPILERVSTELGYNYADGFNPDRKLGVFKWDEKMLGSERINIYKMHGSVTWYKKDNNVLKFPAADISKTPGIKTLMVYPAELKDVLNPPFSQLHRKFEEVLFQSNLCIAIGHNFQDSYIRNLFLERLKRKNFRIYLICGKFTRSLKKRIFGATNMVSPIINNFEGVDLAALVKKAIG